MPVVSLTVGATSASTTLTAAEVARVIAAITADRNQVTTAKQALAFSLQMLLDDIINRVVAYEAKQVVVIPIVPTPIT